MSNSNAKKYDAIIIGSGIGGLTAAAILSKYSHKKVLSLEQHYVIGGFTHEFERQGFHWDVGLHYVGDMGEGELGRQIFDYITEGKLHWNKMPNPFEKFVYPDFTFEVYSEPQKYQSDLIRMFPEEKAAIKKYFADIKKANRWNGLQASAESFPAWLNTIVKLFVKNFGKIIRLTTKEYFDRNFQNPKLKSLLVSQWGTYALPPSQSSFGIHALIVNHYLNGARWCSDCRNFKRTFRLFQDNFRSEGVIISILKSDAFSPESFTSFAFGSGLEDKLREREGSGDLVV
jgi:phytoene dehydrogenase-like protein